MWGYFYFINIIDGARKDGKLYISNLSKTNFTFINNVKIEHNTPVSMNILGLNKHLFDGLVPLFSKFLKKLNKDILTAEFLLPDVLAEMMKNDGVDLISLKSSAKWQGITYKEDKEKLVNFLKEQTETGIYPKKLWK